jgi:hypothetical protein
VSPAQNPAAIGADGPPASEAAKIGADANEKSQLGRDPALIVVCGDALIDMIQNPDCTERTAPSGGPYNIVFVVGGTALFVRRKDQSKGERWPRAPHLCSICCSNPLE